MYAMREVGGEEVGTKANGEVVPIDVSVNERRELGKDGHED
jgi:hypothetical protein